MTKPTRAQDRAASMLAEALVSVVTAARLDEKAKFGPAEVRALLAALAKASSAFDKDTIVARALEQRGHALGLREGTSELLTLLESDLAPVDALLLDDDAFKARVEAVEEEL